MGDDEIAQAARRRQRGRQAHLGGTARAGTQVLDRGRRAPPGACHAVRRRQQLVVDARDGRRRLRSPRGHRHRDRRCRRPREPQQRVAARQSAALHRQRPAATTATTAAAPTGSSRSNRPRKPRPRRRLHRCLRSRRRPQSRRHPSSRRRRSRPRSRHPRRRPPRARPCRSLTTPSSSACPIRRFPRPGHSAAFARPAGITRSGENDEFGRGVIRALRRTMPGSDSARPDHHPAVSCRRPAISSRCASSGAAAIQSWTRTWCLPPSNRASRSRPPAPPSVDRTFLVTYVYR